MPSNRPFHQEQIPWTSESLKRSHRRKVYGVGINDAPYNTAKCLYYDKWRTMLRRCYAEEYQERHPNYNGCTVDPRWHYFMAFREWLVQEGFVRGLAIDKDLLVPGNKVYSPETCILVTQSLNNFTTMNKSTRTINLPTGVRKASNSNKYQSMIKVDNQAVCLGTYDTPEEASKVYLNKKSEVALIYSERETNPKIKQALINFSKMVKEYIK